MTLEEIIRETKAYRCLECGECRGGCPIAWGREQYSPRLFVQRAMFGFEDRVLKDPDLWSCLTCGLCNERCPSGVDYTGFMRDLRARAFEDGMRGVSCHGGLIQLIMEIQAAGLKQNRTDWLSEDLETSESGEYLFYTGCLPYFQILFEDTSTDSLQSATGALKLLNKLGIAPIVSNDERCCGHDFLWSGDMNGFEKLAQYNLEAIRKSGAEKVVFYCPECYETFRTDYVKHFGELGFEPIHLTKFLVEHPDFGKLTFEEEPCTVTYQDPCRLGRFAGIYEEPRDLIRSLPGVRLIEMDKERTNSVCCGSSQWSNCFSYSKQIQMDRLKEAQDTGAEVLVTACPKCKIHFDCALHRDDMGLDIKDLVTMVVDRIRQ